MLTCWGARFHPRHIEPASIFFFKNPFVQFTLFWRWIHQMNGNLNTSYVDFLVMLCWPPMDKGSFPRLVLLPSQELRFRSISWDKSGSNMSCLSIQSILSRLNEQIFIIYPEFRTGYIFSKERTFSNKSAINMPQIQTYLLNASWCMSNKLYMPRSPAIWKETSFRTRSQLMLYSTCTISWTIPR